MRMFLQHVAHDLFDKTGGEFHDVTVVFPNKRASLFFNTFLWQKAGGRVMWTPQYTTIVDLFNVLSDLQTGDPVYLVCMLHDVYRKHFPNDSKTFDELYPLLEMMLADFQEIDSNMVAADKLFRNVKELQDMNDYSFLEPGQIAAIQHFFNGVNWHSGTREQQRFATIWDKLLDIYTDYHATLLSQPEPMVYDGMMKRRVIDDLSADEGGAAFAKLTSRLYVFVGFNVLNATELELFRRIRQHRDALFYWDYDEAFMQTCKDIDLPFAFPGAFVKENIRIFGNALSGDSPVYHSMRASKKEIAIIQSPTDNAQARYINEWTNEHVKQGMPLTDCAVVLCNEGLLQPVIHSIPAAVGTSAVTLNVTMGYPLVETPAYSLVQALMELQLKGRTKHGAWRYKQTAAVLKHPYIRRMSGGRANDVLSLLTAANVIFPTDSAFADDQFLHLVFTKHSGKSLTRYIADVLAMASQCFTTGGSSWDEILYKESVFISHNILNRLNVMQESLESLSMLSDRTVARIVSQSLQRVSIPFHGEPADGMQVMGFLETRNLDFRHVVLLSANDEQMPRAAKRPSLIPYTLQSAFGMTTIDKEVSIYAYYFYRLMARAESVTVMWNSSTDGGHKGEMSRFLMQMMCEAGTLFHPDQTFALRQLHAPSVSMPFTSLSVEKNDETMRRLHERFDIATEQTEAWREHHGGDDRLLILSPSAINSYMRCQLQFFLRYVAHLRPDDDVSEDVDDAIFGDIFHYAMEQLYKPTSRLEENNGKVLTSSRLRAMANDDATLRQLVDQGFMIKLFKMTEEEGQQRIKAGQINYSGSQLIKHYVIRTLLRKQLLADARTAEEAERTGGSLTILAVEERHFVEREITCTGAAPFKVRLGGVIDRIDMVDNGLGQRTIQVVDYKTSSRPQTAKDVAQLFDSKKACECYHITQTLYYCDVLCEEGVYGADTQPVVPAIMYYKNNIREESPVVQLNYPCADRQSRTKPYITNYAENCRNDFNPLMNNVIESIFSPGVFVATDNTHCCSYCDFKHLCRRKIKEKGY